MRGLIATNEAADLLRDAPWRRLAVLGDSLAEGIGDRTAGYPTGGWAATMARALRQVDPDSAYVNVGRRYLVAREVQATQLRPALDFGPDLAVLVCGGNDLLQPAFDPAAVASALDDMVGALRGQGSDVLLFGPMDITRAGLIDRRWAPTMHARLVALSDLNRDVAEQHDAFYLHLVDHPAAADPAVYSRDRLHLNGYGHAVVAGAVIRRLSEQVRHRASEP